MHITQANKTCANKTQRKNFLGSSSVIIVGQQLDLKAKIWFISSFDLKKDFRISDII